MKFVSSVIVTRISFLILVFDHSFSSLMLDKFLYERTACIISKVAFLDK